MPTPDEKQIADLKAQYHDLGSVEVGEDLFIFRKPTRQEYNRWFDTRDDRPSESGSELAQSCLVFPDRAGFIAALVARPSLLMQGSGFVDIITDLAGASTAQDAKPKKKIL